MKILIRNYKKLVSQYKKSKFKNPYYNLRRKYTYQFTQSEEILKSTEHFRSSSSNSISLIDEAKIKHTNLVHPNAKLAAKLGSEVQCKLCYNESGKANFPVHWHVATPAEDQIETWAQKWNQFISNPNLWSKLITN